MKMSTLKKVQSPLLASLALLLPALSYGQNYAIVGDGGDWGKNAQSVRDSILRKGESRLLMPGDNLYSWFSTYDAHWSPWSSKGLQFTAVAIGNHNAGYAKEVQYFKMPGEFYSMVLENGTIRLIVLNSDNRSNVEQQREFLELELLDAKEPLVFVMYHHPSLTVTDDHSWLERKNFHENIRPLLFRHREKITAVINGHDHIASLHEFDDLPVIVSGAVQDTRSPSLVNNTQEGINVRTRWLFEEATHWVKLIPSATSPTARLEYIRAKDDRIVCTVDLQTGKRATLGTDCSGN